MGHFPLRARIVRGLTLTLALLTLASPVSAIKLIGSGRIYDRPGIDSAIAVGCALSAQDAAMRLYYLGMLTGTGSKLDGSMDFSLKRGLSRVESAVFAVRLFGAEETALAEHCEHPFEDVPDWASDYVGYVYACGLLDDLTGQRFEPMLAETSERFCSYMLYALGYRMEEKDYTPLSATDYLRDAGLYAVEPDEPLTRGDAALTMYNVLRATLKGSQRICSDRLVELGAISYQDAIFFLWNRDQEETRQYMDAVGYGSLWTVPDGYYRIRAAEGSKLLNVAMDGANNDYDGVPMTLWRDTDDITQTYRLERTPRGTYYIYSAASKSGYNRVIGAYGTVEADQPLRTGLYRSTSRQALEFILTPQADGTWSFTAADSGAVLSAENGFTDGASVSLTEPDGARMVSWELERQGILSESGMELAIFVAESLRVTQGAFDDYSHMTQNAIDIQPTESCVRAPFEAEIVRIDDRETACHAVWIQSRNPVVYADGSVDYMTIAFLHDNDISDLYVGMPLTQGQYFYDSGDFGVATGYHVHVACYRGVYDVNTMAAGNGDVLAEDALFLPDDTVIYEDYGLDWVRLSLAH